MLKKDRASFILRKLNALYEETPIPLNHKNNFELLKNIDLFDFLSVPKEIEYSLSLNTELLAGFILMAERSPPKAPNAPAIDSNLAVPLGLSKVIFKISCRF